MELGTIVGGVFAVLGGIAAVIWIVLGIRFRRERRERARFIEKYSFPAELRNRLQRETGLSLSQSGRVLEGLRQYFLVCLSAQRRSIAREVGMPSKAVDAAWHEFIVLTREYAKFCQGAFGRYLHHTPKAMMEGRTADSLANTLHQFKQPSPTSAAWAMAGTMPLLFALDRELGFKDGYIYDDAAIGELERHRLALTATSDGGGGGDSGSGDSSCSGGGDSGGGGCGGGGCGS